MLHTCMRNFAWPPVLFGNLIHASAIVDARTAVLRRTPAALLDLSTTLWRYHS